MPEKKNHSIGVFVNHEYPAIERGEGIYLYDTNGKRYIDASGGAAVKAIVYHPMETGRRKDKGSGKVVPANFITEIVASVNGDPVLTGLWGPTVSANPFWSFEVADCKAGDKVSISWVDNLGQTGASEASVS